MSAIQAMLRGAARALVLDPRQNPGHGSRAWDEGYAYISGHEWQSPRDKSADIWDDTLCAVSQIGQDQTQEAPVIPEPIPVPTECRMSAHGHPCIRITTAHRIHKCACGRSWAA